MLPGSSAKARSKKSRACVRYLLVSPLRLPPTPPRWHHIRHSGPSTPTFSTCFRAAPARRGGAQRPHSNRRRHRAAAGRRSAIPLEHKNSEQHRARDHGQPDNREPKDQAYSVHKPPVSRQRERLGRIRQPRINICGAKAYCFSCSVLRSAQCSAFLSLPRNAFGFPRFLSNRSLPGLVAAAKSQFQSHQSADRKPAQATERGFRDWRRRPAGGHCARL